MKVIPRLTATAFRRLFSKLAKTLRQQRGQFAKQLESLLGQISDGGQFRQIFAFCINVAAGPAIIRAVIHAWDAAMEFRLFVVEIRKRFVATFSWLVANAEKYAEVYRQCAPGAAVARRIKHLFEAAGYPLPA